jgi:hypothetical protein
MLCQNIIIDTQAYPPYTYLIKKQVPSAPSKLGVSCGVKVSIGKGSASHPYRVLRDWEG